MSAAVLSEPGMALTMTSEGLLVQVEGKVDGCALYFRTRGGRWSCRIAKDTRCLVRSDLLYRGDGACKTDGAMEREEGWRLVRSSIADWRARRTR